MQAHPHVQLKLKRRQREEEDRSRQERDNRLLLNSISETYKGHRGGVDNWFDYKRHDLSRARQRNAVRIMHENRGFLKQLEAAKSEYGRKFWESDYQQSRRYVANASRVTPVERPETAVGRPRGRKPGRAPHLPPIAGTRRAGSAAAVRRPASPTSPLSKSAPCAFPSITEAEPAV